MKFNAFLNIIGSIFLIIIFINLIIGVCLYVLKFLYPKAFSEALESVRASRLEKLNKTIEKLKHK
jgi:hypothetical protein